MKNLTGKQKSQIATMACESMYLAFYEYYGKNELTDKIAKSHPATMHFEGDYIYSRISVFIKNSKSDLLLFEIKIKLDYNMNVEITHSHKLEDVNWDNIDFESVI